MKKKYKKLKNLRILVTGGAGFIGSNICEFLLKNEAKVVCLDNFSTGKKHNLKDFTNHSNFSLINGDIRDLKTCQIATRNIDFVLHQAALGSVPRSIADPITTNQVNIDGFLNILIASRDNNVKRFIFAASSSTYGDSKSLPKKEDQIGKPLSPYAITKYVNELYAENFKNLYDLDWIGLRYFNVFGKRQDPNGAYAAVIPKFISKLINKESPIINGDGLYSRDFTYIDNIIQLNILSILTKNPRSLNQVYNGAFGEQTNLNELTNLIKIFLSNYDKNILDIKPIHGKFREGDIPHSLACIKKSKKLLNYSPTHNLENGLKESIKWYYENLSR